MQKPLYLVVTPFFPSPESWRGAYCFDFVQALQREGTYDVRVFVPGKGPDYVYQGVHVYRFPTRQLPSALLPFLFEAQNQRAFLRKVAQVGMDVQSIAVCHGHTATFSSYPLAIKRLNPHCLTLLHHHDPGSFGLRLGRLRHCWLYNLTQFCAYRRRHEAIEGHVFISEPVRKSFLAVPDTDWSCYDDYRRTFRGLGCFRSPQIRASTILHNGVDTTVFTAEGRQPHNGFVIGCIANFVDWKRQCDLLTALSSLRTQLGDWRVRFVGSGPTLAQCQAYVIAQGLESQVSFETEVDHTQLPAFYRSLDLFVLPSIFEGFGCVFTEAWACGTPFITCEGQGMEDMIYPEERPLWLCRPRDPSDLAQKILAFYQHRPKQHMVSEIDIQVLVGTFIKEMEHCNG